MPSRCRLAAAAAVLLVLTDVRAASAQKPDQVQRVQPAESFSVAIDGAPPPVAPASITRDDRGRATIRAIKLREPLTLDGRLDEAVYAENRSVEGFLQTAPRHGQPSSERTEAWVMYDDTHVYVACRCWDSASPEEWVANELRRDTNGLRNNEHFGVMFDTFYDRRNGFLFYANPLEARADYSVIDEGGSNTDWNPVWDVKSATFDGGWSIELAIPLKSIRYLPGENRVWGIQMRRSIRHKNEWTYLNPVPEILAGPQAFNRISAGGTLVGLDLPAASANLEFKPYGIAGITTDRLAIPALDNDTHGDAGIDFKYGLTPSLTADLTVNTDFAQVEIDEQQVNLTRFSLFFPEKREFFLEGRGVFDFGGGRGGPGGGGFGGGNDAPSLFYSRRIGLERGPNGSVVVPIDVGGRVTGKVGPWGIGLINIQTGDESTSGVESTNFSVVRIKRDILRRSAIGAIFTNRSVSTRGTGSNQAYGMDASFAFFQNLEMGGYWARTRTEGLEGEDNESYSASLEYSGDKYGATFQHLKVGDVFNPEVGFARRSSFLKTAGSLRFSPRPASIVWIRKLTWQVNLDHYENLEGVIESRDLNGRFNVERENSDQFSIQGGQAFERLTGAFRVGTDAEGENVVIPVGDYSFHDVRFGYNLGQQRRVAGNVSLQLGEFYDGTITSFGLSGGRVVVSDQFSLEPGLTINRIDLPGGEVDQNLFRTRADYAFSPRMFASALVQYNTNDRTFSGNLRFRWEYRPGSELFVVWTDERGTGDVRDTRPGFVHGLRSRALVLKATRLFRF